LELASKKYRGVVKGIEGARAVLLSNVLQFDPGTPKLKCTVTSGEDGKVTRADSKAIDISKISRTPVSTEGIVSFLESKLPLDQRQVFLSCVHAIPSDDELISTKHIEFFLKEGRFDRLSSTLEGIDNKVKQEFKWKNIILAGMSSIGTGVLIYGIVLLASNPVTAMLAIAIPLIIGSVIVLGLSAIGLRKLYRFMKGYRNRLILANETIADELQLSKAVGYLNKYLGKDPKTKKRMNYTVDELVVRFGSEDAANHVSKLCGFFETAIAEVDQNAGNIDDQKRKQMIGKKFSQLIKAQLPEEHPQKNHRLSKANKKNRLDAIQYAVTGKEHIGRSQEGYIHILHSTPPPLPIPPKSAKSRVAKKLQKSSPPARDAEKLARETGSSSANRAKSN
jgi:hypothetical protein